MTMNDARPSLEVIVLSGALGSGKTTLLVDWLRDHPSPDVGLIINEAGDIDIDGVVVMNQANGRPVKMLPSGCLCCSLRDDLVDTIAGLVESKYQLDGKPLRKIVIETSGLAQPAAVVASLLVPELLGQGLNVQVLCTFDATCNPAVLDRQAQAQIACAQRIFLTKTDLIARAVVPDKIAALKRINPLADYVATGVRLDDVLNAFERQEGIRRDRFHELLTLKSAPAPHGNVQVICRRLPDEIEWHDFASHLDDLTAFYSERLLRSKMLLKLRGEKSAVLLQSVGHRFGAPMPVPGVDLAESLFVFILQDVEKAEFDAKFEQTVGQCAAGQALGLT